MCPFRKHDEPFRTRCEVKNVNSIRFVMQAVEVEARRQIGVWESGGAVEQETRLFDSGRGETRSMRSKEDAHDYRYFPDPDLLPLVLDEAWIEGLRRGCRSCRMPSGRGLCRSMGCRRMMRGCWWRSRRRLGILRTVARGRDAKAAANWVMGDLFGALNRTGRTIEDSPVSAAALGEMLDLMGDGTINGRIAKDVFEAMVATGEGAGAIVESRGLRQVTDTGAIDAAIAAVMAGNMDKVEQYRAGKDKLFGFFVGQVMKAMGGKGNPGLVNDALRERLG